MTTAGSVRMWAQTTNDPRGAGPPLRVPVSPGVSAQRHTCPVVTRASRPALGHRVGPTPLPPLWAGAEVITFPI